MALLASNNANSSLLNAISNVATTLFVQTADASLFPTPVAAGDYFMLVIEDPLQNPIPREIVRCTARNANQLTVVRAQENTTNIAWAAGVTVSNRLTAGTITTLAAGTTSSTQLYLGAYSSPPSQTLDGRSLIRGNLYYDTTLQGLYEFDGVNWGPVTAKTQTAALGLFLGSFAVPPITMPDGSALVAGTLYYSTSIPGLQVYANGAWQASTNTISTSQSLSSANSVSGNMTVDGNVNATGDGFFENVTAVDTVSCAALIMGGAHVVSAGDISGTNQSQHFPSGMVIKWGTGTTDNSGFSPIDFAEPFPNGIITALAVANLVGAVTAVTARSVSGLTITAWSPLTHSGTGPDGVVGSFTTGFDWIAIGH